MWFQGVSYMPNFLETIYDNNRYARRDEPPFVLANTQAAARSRLTQGLTAP